MQYLISSPFLTSVTHTTIAMMAVINPVICGIMIMQLGQGLSKKENIIASIKSMLIVLSILLLAAVAGKTILNSFGISINAFKVVGGIILSVIGFQLLTGTKSKVGNTDEQRDLSSLIMFAASPGTITMVITLSAANNIDGFPISVMMGSVLAIIITMVVMISMLFMARKNHGNRPSYFSKFMGLIIVSMGLQFILDGIKMFFNL